MRINKYISSKTHHSRRKAEQLIMDSRIKVNGKVLTQLSYQVKDSDEVHLDDMCISDIKINKHYYIFNKPKKVISAVKDDRGRVVVNDYFPKDISLFPVGRLDYFSRGLVIMTNDGDFANKLIHPSSNVGKVYLVKLDTRFTDNQMNEFAIGIDLEDGKSLPCEIDYYDYANIIYRIKLYEGRNRQIRRMAEFFNKKVVDLERISIGKIKIGNLKEGRYRKFSKKEMDYVKTFKGED